MEDSFRRGEEVRVVKGTKVKEVSRDQLLDERRVLAAGPAGADSGVDDKLRRLDKSYRRQAKAEGGKKDKRALI